MKKKFFLLCFIASFLGYAQQDLKFNISNVFIYEANISYEKSLNDFLTLGGFAGFAYGLPDNDEANKYVYLGPELRYYVAPKNGADQFFVGVYSRAVSGNALITFEESGLSLVNGWYDYYYQTERVNYFKLALGFTLGSKWVTKNGFVYGVFGGLGRNIIHAYDETSFEPHTKYFQLDTYSSSIRNENDSKYWDFRIGFNVGWRFGK